MLKHFVRYLAFSALLVGAFIATPVKPVHAIGNTLYVAMTGSNTGNCQAALSPCLTITYALTQAVDGDQILVAAGTYSEGVVVNVNVSITGAGMQATIVDGGGTGDVFFIPVGKAAYLEKMTIQNGVTSADGGGIENYGNLTLVQVRVTDNNGNRGGGIYSEGPLTLTDVMVYNNISSSSGGGLFLAQAGTATLERVAVYSNHALSGSSYGGGIHHQGGGTLYLTNVSIYNNTSNNGGGVVNTGASTVHVLNSTISGNHVAATPGLTGGFLNYSTADVKNTILSANDLADCENGGTLTDNGYNLLSDSSCGVDFTDPNDLLSTAVLLNFNSPSWSGYISVLAPVPGSPTIDAGNGCPAKDARQVTRPVDGDLDSVATCDIGAYEFRPGSALTITADTPDPSMVGVPVTVNVTVTGPAGTPTGLVYIAVSEANCTATLSAGSGSCILTPTTSGVREIDAYHEGDAQYEGSSNFATHIVTQTSTLLSAGVNDGWVLESGETTNVGGTLNATATTFNLGDDAANKQFRGFLHFNTASLPDTAVITKATLKIKKYGLVGTNPFSTHGGLRVDIRKPFFGTTAGLLIGDFQATAGKSTVATFGVTPVSNWYSALLNATGRAYVNRTGTTQFRLRFTLDDNNDHGADYMKFFSGNYATAASRPTLVIEYYVP